MTNLAVESTVPTGLNISSQIHASPTPTLSGGIYFPCMYPCLFASLLHFYEFIWTPPKAIKRAPPNNGKKIHFSNHGVTGSSGFGISGVILIPSNVSRRQRRSVSGDRCRRWLNPRFKLATSPVL